MKTPFPSRPTTKNRQNFFVNGSGDPNVGPAYPTYDANAICWAGWGAERDPSPESWGPKHWADPHGRGLYIQRDSHTWGRDMHMPLRHHRQRAAQKRQNVLYEGGWQNKPKYADARLNIVSLKNVFFLKNLGLLSGFPPSKSDYSENAWFDGFLLGAPPSDRASPLQSVGRLRGPRYSQGQHLRPGGER